MTIVRTAAVICAGTLLGCALACSSDSDGGGAADAGSGATTGSGGNSGFGGSPGFGGTPSGGSGGITSSGGSSATGGSSAAGGAAGSGGTAGGDGGTADAGSCPPISLGAFSLLDTEPGGSSLAYAVAGLAPGKEHVAYVEFYDVAGPQTAGTFDLSKPPDNNYSSCARCLLLYEDVAGSPTAFFPESGTLELTTPDTTFQGASAGNFKNVKLVEVTLSSTVTTPVNGGRCLSLSGAWKHP